MSTVGANLYYFGFCYTRFTLHFLGSLQQFITLAAPRNKIYVAFCLSACAAPDKSAPSTALENSGKQKES